MRATTRDVPPLYLLPQPRAATVTVVQSYSWVIVEAIRSALAGDTFFNGYTTKRTKMVPLQTYRIPYLAVYFMDDVMQPDGDANAGNIRFNNTLRVGFQVVIANTDEAKSEQTIDAAYWKIANLLWPSKLMNLGGIAMVDHVAIESVVRGVRRHKYGFADAKNETPVAEMEYEASLFYRMSFDPTITDTLKQIYVTTGIKPGDTQAEMDARWQVQAYYNFD